MGLTKKHLPQVPFARTNLFTACRPMDARGGAA